jgi:hypothetical protein
MIAAKDCGNGVQLAIALLLSVAGLDPLIPAVAASPELNSRQQLSQDAKTQILQKYGTLPLSFEVNRGQADKEVRFLSRGTGYSLSLMGNHAVISLSKPGKIVASGETKEPLANDRIGLELPGAIAAPHVTGEDELPGKVNYLVGTDRSKWSRNIPTYTKVRYAGVYPGVDLVYYGNQKQLEYDFVVAPGAETRQIRLHFAGARRVTLDRDGSLTISTEHGSVAFRKPAIYQEVDGQRKVIKGRFAMLAGNSAAFQVGAYDHTLPLVIDPVLAYSTFYGYGFYTYTDQLFQVAVDSSGCAYVIGMNEQYIVTKFDFFASEIVYGTNMGQGGGYPSAIAADAEGHAVVAGNAYNIVATPGAYQSAPSDGYSMFVSELSLDGSDFVYSTYLGPSGNSPAGITVDSSGNIYVTGNVGSNGFPVTFDAYPATSNSGAFFAKINPGGKGSKDLVYSSYMNGASASAIAVDSENNVYLTGQAGPDLPTTRGAFQRMDPNPESINGGPAFLAKFTLAHRQGNDLDYSTYLGGSSGDSGAGIAVDSAGNAYIAGGTGSSDFPVTPGAFQTVPNSLYGTGFISKLSPQGKGKSDLLYSTYFGGSGGGGVVGIGVDPTGNAIVGGTTSSSDFPVTSNAFESRLLGAGSAAFLAKLKPAGDGADDLVFSTYLGGSANANEGGFVPYTATFGFAVDPSGNAYISGATNDENYPGTIGAYDPVLESSGIYDGEEPGNYGVGFLSKVRFNYDPPPPASVDILSGNFQSGQFGIPLAEPLTVRVNDSLGNPIPSTRVTFAGSSFQFSPATTTTGATGEAQVTATPSAACGSTVTASAGGAALPATFYFSNVGPQAIDILAEPVTTTYGQNWSPRVTATGTNAFGQRYDLSVMDAATVKNPPPDPLHAGQQSYTVVAGGGYLYSCGGGSPYTGTSNTAELTIQPAQIRLFATDAKMTYGGGLPTFSYSTIDPPVNSTALAPGSLTGAPEIQTTATSASGVGIYPITISQGSLQITGPTAIDYEFSPVAGTLRVEPAPLIVTPVSISIKAGTQIPPLTYQISGFVNNDPPSVVTGSPGLWTQTGPTPPAGTYTIYSNRGSLQAANYDFIYATGTLTVTP